MSWLSLAEMVSAMGSTHAESLNIQYLAPVYNCTSHCGVSD